MFNSQRNFNTICLDIFNDHKNICIFLRIGSLRYRMTTAEAIAQMTEEHVAAAAVMPYRKEPMHKNIHVFL